MTPQVIDHAEEVARDPTASRRLGDLQFSSHQWAGHVSQLIEATQKANYPWSKTAERLVSAAKRGEGLEAQVGGHTLKYRAHTLTYTHTHTIIQSMHTHTCNFVPYCLQKKHVSTQTSKMVDVAMVTVAAAETEEAIGAGSGSSDDSERSHDPELLVG